jgi:aspartate 1-decarboxylase
MKRNMLKSKIHKARVTDRRLDYEGSTTIDAALMKAVDILHHENIQVYNLTNGKRFETYAIEAPEGSGEICVNGAAAHLVEKGDEVIIASYAFYDEEEVKTLEPGIIVLDERNRIARKV